MDLPRIEIFGDDDIDAFALKIDLDGYEIALAGAAPTRAPQTSSGPRPTDRPSEVRQALVAAPAAPGGRRPQFDPGSRAMSFVLTIALSDTGRPGSDLARLRILLASFVKHFDMRFLADFIVITRPNDFARVGEELAAFPQIPTLRLLSELDLCPELHDDPDTTDTWPTTNKGWHRQQLLKLACYEQVRSPFYMTLDSDVLFITSFKPSDLFLEGKVVVNTQTRQDYDRIWHPRIAEEQVTCRLQRNADAFRILGMHRPSDRFYGETPVVLSTKIVKELVCHLETRAELGWRRYLLDHLPWTEYNLYFTFAEATRLFDVYHAPGGFDAVLGMSNSLWLPAECYIDGRNLQSWRITRKSSYAVVAVIQSYLGYPADVVEKRATELSIL
jgi:hypothetical protein